MQGRKNSTPRLFTSLVPKDSFIDYLEEELYFFL
jgi:hypothetical protein